MPALEDILAEARIVNEIVRFEASSRRPLAVQDNWRPVLMIPGFLAGDATLYPLGGRLREIGHHIFYSGIWINADCPERTINRVVGKIGSIAARTRRKVVLLGHSLGGVYAREAARRVPNLVERAFLLGSPVRGGMKNSNPFLAPLIGAMRFAHRDCIARLAIDGELPLDPPPVAETVIYTKTDGIVSWQCCLECGDNVENFEVDSSHCGLPLHPQTLEIIASQLSGEADAGPDQALAKRAIVESHAASDNGDFMTA